MIFTRFATLLTEILRYSESHQTTIIIDEFQRLAEKYKHIKRHFQGYTVELIGLSLENM